MSTSNPRTLCGLPNDLKLNIAGLLYESRCATIEGVYDGTPGDILIPLSCTSRDWRNTTLPYVFRVINLPDKTNEALAGLIEMVAVKYGHYCRSLGICLQPDPLSALWASDEIDSITGARSPKHTWQVTRNSLLLAMVHFMPSLEEVCVVFNDCPWHDISSPCYGLDIFEPLIDSLAERALESIHIHFGSTYSSLTGSGYLATRLLLGTQDTVERVRLQHFRDGHTYDSFDIANVLEIVQDLPYLRDLRLSGVCCLADLSDCNWTSPLQTLRVDPDYRLVDNEAAARDDKTSLGLKSLPNTLRHLHLGRWEFQDSFTPLPSACPANLALLESLNLDFIIVRSALDYFRASNILTLTLLGEYGLQMLSRVLEDHTAFPRLKRLHVQIHTERTGETYAKQAARALLNSTCKARNVTITFMWW